MDEDIPVSAQQKAKEVKKAKKVKEVKEVKLVKEVKAVKEVKDVKEDKMQEVPMTLKRSKRLEGRT